ncbi:MAG TPA: amino acid permease [Candidatus Acidoferrales bacterium]|nr:amino acid permease [Candidatus Acidoferrales bacterium]
MPNLPIAQNSGEPTSAKDNSAAASLPVSASGLAARLGIFDATMIVMGGIIGAGIFINPYVVAQQVHTPALILGAWIAGGVIALGGAFIWAELAATMPRVGGQYAYLREAYHPLLAFLYGWVLLLVIQTGGMAAVAVTFAQYFLQLAPMHASENLLAISALAILTGVNCLGVRAGSTVQSALMVLKIVAIAALVLFGMIFLAHRGIFGGPPAPPRGLLDRPVSFDLVTAFGAALVPVLFSYGGWQTANFVAEEIREPRKNLPRALVTGVVGVILLYLSVNFVCVYVLGSAGLAGTTVPASAVMRVALGSKGSTLIAVGITISALGFLSQSILTAPRVYFAMAEDGLFFRSVAWLDPRRRVPVVAIAVQGLAAILIALSGRYDQILSYVVSMDFLFFGLTATCIFVFRRRTAGPAGASRERFARMPGHPITTFLFVSICWLVVINTIFKYPRNTAVGFGILLAGIPAYFFWAYQKKRSGAA